MEFYTSDKFTCAVSYTYPVAAWKSWAGEATRYQIYGICGLKTTLTIAGSTLQASCQAAANRCGYDVNCVRDQVVADHQNGRYRFCSWGSFNLLVNRHPGESAYKGYNGAHVWNNYAHCVGYCTE